MTTDTGRTSREKAAEMVAAFDDGMSLDTWLSTHHRDVPRLARDYIALLDVHVALREAVEKLLDDAMPLNDPYDLYELDGEYVTAVRAALNGAAE